MSALAAPAPDCAELIQGTIAAAAVINEVIAVIMAKKGFELAGELGRAEGGGAEHEAERRQERSRAAILEAAAQEFLAAGLRGRDSGRHLRRTRHLQGMMYHYFSGREELFLRCVEEVFGGLRFGWSRCWSGWTRWSPARDTRIFPGAGAVFRGAARGEGDL